jgi:hypothetical protein
MSKPATYHLIEQRIAQLGSWLDDESPFARLDQRHLDPGTPEQSYWHLGYMTALRDALALMQVENDGVGVGDMQSPRDGGA